MLPTISDINNTKTTDSSDKLADSLKNNDLLSRDAFLKLFIEQLKNQDPLNPMKNYELSAQLAQFSQLEQLYDINKNFNNFTKSLNKTNYFQGINLIGKKVEYEGDEIEKSGDNPINIKFKLSDDASDVNINIYDDKDNYVKTIQLHDLTKGENSATWDGKDATGNSVKNGIYKYEIIAYNREGEKLDYTGYGSGLITSLRFDPETNEALFKVNNEEISIDKIVSISNQSDISQIFQQDTPNSDNNGNSSDSSSDEEGAG